MNDLYVSINSVQPADRSRISTVLRPTHSEFDTSMTSYVFIGDKRKAS